MNTVVANVGANVNTVGLTLYERQREVPDDVGFGNGENLNLLLGMLVNPLQHHHYLHSSRIYPCHQNACKAAAQNSRADWFEVNMCTLSGSSWEPLKSSPPTHLSLQLPQLGCSDLLPADHTQPHSGAP